jgi:hypothetical protein
MWLKSYFFIKYSFRIMFFHVEKVFLILFNDHKRSIWSSLLYNLYTFEAFVHGCLYITPLKRGQVIIPTAHYSDNPLLRRPIIPTAHCSDSPFLRQPITGFKIIILPLIIFDGIMGCRRNGLSEQWAVNLLFFFYT